MEEKELSQEEIRLLASVLPNVGSELRLAMANMYTAFNRIAPKSERKKDQKLDTNASYFLQSYYRLNRLAGNLSDASLLAENRRFTLLNGDIIALARKVCGDAEEFFEAEGVSLRFECRQQEQIIAMDAGMMEKLLLNLLSNALKFTPAGGTVTVRIHVTETQVFLSVADTGKGIARDKLNQLFNCFLVTDALNPPPLGLGLGLAICLSIAKGHGGSIAVESTEGKGAVFTVSLPNALSNNLIFREPKVEYAGGFNRTLVELSDALSSKTFTSRYMN